ncbi:hypothetical protein SDC9_135058 [bioreactor metagenome]|uniref:Uncharacterized protein n=1 Tax=bioreactor metagenome TaxID=1076179 RepID=A0A645DFB6_9ZZZZ
MRAHVQFLVDDGDAKLLRLFGGQIAHFFVKNFYTARITRVHAAEDLHQRGFARTVFPQQGHYLS